jgi:hypothetical protein
MKVEIREHYKTTDKEFIYDIRKIEVFINNELFDEFREGYAVGLEKYMAYPFVEGLSYGRDDMEIITTQVNDMEW